MAESRPGVPLIATKGLRYGTRRLLAEENFTARRRDARLLVAIGKARYVTADAVAADTAPAAKPDDIKELREAYQAKTGKKAFHGWDAPALRAKIAEA
jgi:hypothetical protein